MSHESNSIIYEVTSNIKWHDAGIAAEMGNDAEIDFDDFGLHYKEMQKDLGQQDLDVCYAMLDFIVSLSGAYELVDYIYGNFAASGIDIDSKKASDILNAVPESSRNQAWAYLVADTNAEIDTDAEIIDL